MQRPPSKVGADYQGAPFSEYPSEGLRADPATYFESILPEVKRRAEIVFRFSNAEQRREQVQEVLCLAWKDFLRCIKNGKRFTPGTLTYYATLHVKSGNLWNGKHAGDAMSTANRLSERSSLTDLSEDLIDNRIRSPREQVRLKVDYGDFMRHGGMNHTQKRFFSYLIRGFTKAEARRAMGIRHKCQASYLRREIKRKFVAFYQGNPPSF
jgi:hypothetical protein